MSAHVVAHRKRALALRSPTKVHARQERFTPTAIFQDPDPFPPTTVIIHGHPANTVVILPQTTPVPVPASVPATTAVVPLPQLTTSTPVVIPTTTSPIVIVPPPLPATTRSTVTSTSIITMPYPSPTAANGTLPPSDVDSSSASSGSRVGAAIGGVGAGIVAIAAVGFLIAFIVRRRRKREQDEVAKFDVQTFRRSAIIIPDPPTHEDTINRGYNPPRTGMDQRQQIPISASTWGYNGSRYGDNNMAGYGSSNQQYPSFVPGQLVSPVSPPLTASSAQPLMASPASYSPISLASHPYAPAAVITRQGSMASSATPHSAISPYPSLARQLTLRSAHIPADDYVDLNRSSVSPFQAAQYEEISRKLNSEPPSGLSTPAVLYATQQKDLPPVPPELNKQASPPPVKPASPFADPDPPISVPPSLVLSSPEAPEPVALPVHAPPSIPVSPAPSSSTVLPVPAPPSIPVSPSASSQTLTVHTFHVPTFSTDSLTQEELQFPVPPSPALSYSSRYRVDPLPPTLPEIKLQERTSINSFIKTPVGSGFPSGVSNVSGLGMGLQTPTDFVHTPSPLASSFGMPTPSPDQDGALAQAQAKAVKEQNPFPRSLRPVTGVPNLSVSPPESKKGGGKRPTTTLYDPEDAYGGI